MAELDWIVMSADERARATVLNDDQAFLGARRIVLGDHAGQWVVPARMLTDPDYERWHADLSCMSRLRANPDALFRPPEPDIEAD